MLNCVISWEDCWFFRFFNFVKNAPLCHFVRGPCIFSRLQLRQKYSVFVILWEDRGFLRFFNFVKNAQFCHFQRGPWICFTFSILSQIVHFVTCEKWTSNYEIRISILYVHYVLWYIKLFCQKGSILSFCERTVDFYNSSILSKMLNFVILWERRGFFRFFNFVKNAPFCHFVRGPCIFSRLQFCQKCSILSLCERTVECFDSSILLKTLNFVNFREACGYSKLFCQKGSILSLSEKPV